MMLKQDPLTGFWTEFDGDYSLINVHDIHSCSGHGCAIHNHPSDHALKDAPMNWREDAGKLERICKHGIGHDDYDSVQYLVSIGYESAGIHGCDGCCA